MKFGPGAVMAALVTPRYSAAVWYAPVVCAGWVAWVR